MKRRTFLQGTAAAATGPMTFVSHAQAAKVLKFSHTDQATGARQKAAELFGQKIEQYTEGRYKLQIYPAGQLADDAKSVEQLRIGGLDFTVTGAGTYATHIPTMNLTALPFMIDTYEQGWKFYDESKWMQAQYAKAPPFGFRYLSTFEAGFRSITTKTQVLTPADAKGMKIRSFPNEMMRWTLEAMGFGVQIIPLPEVYLAIQQGTVAGQENPIDTIFTNKFFEVAPYVTLTQHVYSPIPLTMSEKTWQRVSAADREAITKAAKEAATWSRQTVRANDDRQIQEMTKLGAHIAKPDIAPWRTAVQPVFAQAKTKYGADVDAVLADVEAIRKG